MALTLLRHNPDLAMSPAASSKLRRWWYWPRRLLPLVLAIWVADAGLSWLLQHTRLHRYLDSRLANALGRPVEVDAYSFSVLHGMRLEAESVTVDEDPRFGHEYFLRAEGLTVRLRWRALLRGRLELGTLSLTQPSLNLVRASDGRWNLAEWLPRPSPATASSGSAVGAPRLQRIEVDSGRINFKLGQDKLPFALIEVNGRVEQDGPGRWLLDLEAQPMRAAVVVQQAGTLRLQGIVGGTSSRLRPADFELTWQDASLSDLLRLARDTDYGVRGIFSASLKAHTEGPQWDFAARAEFRRLHRWDLPFRADNPAANVSAKVRWLPESPRIELTEGLIEAPRSTVRTAGILDWSSGHPPRAALHFDSPAIQMDDLLSWYRAFHSGVAEELALRGTASIDFGVAGWPPQLVDGSIATWGIELEGGSLRAPVRMGPLVAEFQPDHWKLAPVTLTFGSEAQTLRIEASAARQRPDWKSGWKSSLAVFGEAEHVEDFFETAAAFGWSLPRGWEITGPAKVELRWQGEPYPPLMHPLGAIELNGTTLRAPFLNRPIALSSVRIESSAADQRVILTVAQAFGARWSGTLSRHDAAAPWQWDLSADRLNAADLDRWLNPQWREGLLQRVLPFLVSSQVPAVLPSSLRGQGKLSVDQFVLPSLELDRLHAQIDLDGHRITLDNAQAQFYGGTVRGRFQADLQPRPAYHLQAKFERVSLAKLTVSFANLRNRFAGAVSGDLELGALGLGRQALAASLGCQGSFQVRDAQIAGMDLMESLNSASLRSGTSAFPLASARFSCAAGKVKFAELRFAAPSTQIRVTGSVDFGRNLDLRLRALPPVLQGKNASPIADPPGGMFRLTGTLETPQFLPMESRTRP